MDVTYTTLKARPGPLLLAETKDGLLFIEFGDDLDRLEVFTRRWLKEPRLKRGQVAAAAQVKEYLAGQRQTFDLPLVLTGTDFQKRVWKAMSRIPYGRTRTYGQLARQVGRPAAARAIGAACAANPVPLVVPCHRVVGQNGALTGFGGGLAWKQWLLDLETGAAG